MTEISSIFETNQINSVISTESINSSFETNEINTVFENTSLKAEFQNNELTVIFEKSIIINSSETSYSQDVLDISEVEITHGLNKYVTPIFIDVNNQAWDTAVEYMNLNTIRCFFSPNFSGKIICR